MPIRVRFRLLACVLAMLALPAFAQQKPAQHLTVQLVSEQASVAPGDTANLGLHFKIDPHWHIYWVNAGDSGQPPKAKWQVPQGVTIDDFQWPTPKRLGTATIRDYGYEDSVLLIAPAQIPNSAKGSLPFKATVNYLVCSDMCIPGKEEVSLTIPVGTTAADPNTASLFEQTRATLPRPLPNRWKLTGTQDEKQVTLSLASSSSIKDASFFPLDQEVIENAAPQSVTPTPKGARLALKKSDQLQQQPKSLRGLLALADGTAYAVDVPLDGKTAAESLTPDAAPAGTKTSTVATASEVAAKPSAPTNTTTSSTGAAILFAFLGGLVLNFMPCVFPVLTLKVLGFVSVGAEERGRLRRHGIVYAIGILVSFWVLVGALLALRSAGQHLGWGFQLQSPGFVAGLAAVMLLFGLNLAGVFEIGLSWMGVGSSLATREGDAGAFFTGVLATVVATPCTAPFMGTAIGFALAQPAVTCVLIFTSLALGLAAPFLLLSFRPGWVRILPKPGRWMETMKQLFAFPLFATAVWLIWVFGQQTSLDATARLLVMLLGVSLAAWVWGRWPARKIATAGALLLIALSALWFARTDMRAEAHTPAGTASAATQSGAWEPFSTNAVAQYRSQGRPVFVDFTAAWCLTCQVNERAVLRTPEFLDSARKNNVVLMKADWTQQDPEITQALASFGKSAVPVYVIYSADPSRPANVLPEGILTTQTVLSAFDSAR